jgi:3-methyladenine DNA glycosylase AlkD
MTTLDETMIRLLAKARIVATLIADPKAVSAELMDAWVKDFNSWDVHHL